MGWKPALRFLRWRLGAHPTPALSWGLGMPCEAPGEVWGGEDGVVIVGWHPPYACWWGAGVGWVFNPPSGRGDWWGGSRPYACLDSTRNS